MRLCGKLGLKWHIHLLDIQGTLGYSFGILQILLGGCMSGVGLVEGRQTLVPTRKYRAKVYDFGITHKQRASVISSRSDAPDGSPPDASYQSPQNFSGPNLVDPVNISLATISAVIGVLLLGCLLYKFYSKWSILGNGVEPIWPPPDASRDEIVQLVALIRMGMIDAHGAPSHVINWVLHGVNAPWPPPGGVESFQRRRQRRHRHAATTRHHNGRAGRSNNFTEGGNIELPPRTTRQYRRGTSRSFSSTIVEPLPLYVRDANLDTNHYSITVLPPDFPPLPPDLLPSAPELLVSSEVHRAMSPTSSSQSYIIEDEDSEIGFTQTGSFREPEDTPLTGLTPRPPPPAILLSSPQPRSSCMFTSATNANEE
ncbi:hypothetical protein EV426DRAFT_17292 [Tirmania nivea]|nr:hypothetical protein EV426DRAFT_17292 [Tirmania nivea]